jgi:hypothetical protein
MKVYLVVAVLVFAFAVIISYGYDHLAFRRGRRRALKKMLAQFAALPPVTADFSTPEGAVLCLENAYREKNLEAAAACRDFAAEARLWLQERGHLSDEEKNATLPETIKAMEKSFRNGMAKGLPPDWIFGKSYFLKSEPFADGLIVVNKYTQTAEGDLVPQQILVIKTAAGWRTVKTLPPLLE